MAGPLEGVTVVEVAGIGPAPFACMLLADLGARVIRVDRLPGGSWLPALNNRGKESVALDLKDSAGAAALLEMVRGADVLVEAFRPGVAERLGIGPEECLAANPRLVYGRMTGWGQDGPLAQTAGHDITYLAPTGALGAIGRAGGPPQIPLNLLGDLAGGSLYLAVGVLAGVLSARRTGKGQVVDAAIVDGVAHLSSFIHELLGMGGWVDQRGVNGLDSGQLFYDVYETADGEYMAVGAVEPPFYQEFVRLLGLEEVLAPREDPRTAEGNRRAIEQRFRERTRAEWTEVFDGSDACVAPVLSWFEAPDHPHLRERGTVVRSGRGVSAAPAPRFSGTPAADAVGTAVSPEAGQHTIAVLTELGVDPAPLLEAGVAHQS